MFSKRHEKSPRTFTTISGFIQIPSVFLQRVYVSKKTTSEWLFMGNFKCLPVPACQTTVKFNYMKN